LISNFKIDYTVNERYLQASAWKAASDESSHLERQDKEDLFKMLFEKLDGWWT